VAEPWRRGGVFATAAEAYDARRSGYPRDLVRAAIELAGLGPDARVVEVGSGTGKLTEELVAWLAHPGYAVPEAGKLSGPATLTAVRRIKRQTAEELWALFETIAIYHRLTPQVRDALQAEDERIIERAGGTLRSTQLVALVTASTVAATPISVPSP
jgi:hypothetical protein